MRQRSWFRLEVVALVLVGVALVYVSLNPRHKPRGDDGTYPKVPTDTPTISR